MVTRPGTHVPSGGPFSAAVDTGATGPVSVALSCWRHSETRDDQHIDHDARERAGSAEQDQRAHPGRMILQIGANGEHCSSAAMQVSAAFSRCRERLRRPRRSPAYRPARPPRPRAPVPGDGEPVLTRQYALAASSEFSPLTNVRRPRDGPEIDLGSTGARRFLRRSCAPDRGAIADLGRDRRPQALRGNPFRTGPAKRESPAGLSLARTGRGGGRHRPAALR